MDIELHGRMHPNSDKLFYCVGLVHVYYYPTPLIIGLYPMIAHTPYGNWQCYCLLIKKLRLIAVLGHGKQRDRYTIVLSDQAALYLVHL